MKSTSHKPYNEMALKEYLALLANGDHKCPVCCSDQVEFIEETVGPSENLLDYEAEREARCNECYTRWAVIYKAVRFSIKYRRKW